METPAPSTIYALPEHAPAGRTKSVMMAMSVLMMGAILIPDALSWPTAWCATISTYAQSGTIVTVELVSESRLPIVMMSMSVQSTLVLPIRAASTAMCLMVQSAVAVWIGSVSVEIVSWDIRTWFYITALKVGRALLVTSA
jgi:D-arabinose 1-dehydrogenase-like Zn-dependent alcohol dehydrogenase